MVNSKIIYAKGTHSPGNYTDELYEAFTSSCELTVVAQTHDSHILARNLCF